MLNLNHIRISRLSLSLQREVVYSATLFTHSNYRKTVLLENESGDSTLSHVTIHRNHHRSRPSGFFISTKTTIQDVASTVFDKISTQWHYRSHRFMKIITFTRTATRKLAYTKKKTLLQGFSPLQLNIRRKIHKTTDFSTMLPKKDY